MAGLAAFLVFAGLVRSAASAPVLGHAAAPSAFSREKTGSRTVTDFRYLNAEAQRVSSVLYGGKSMFPSEGPPGTGVAHPAEEGVQELTVVATDVFSDQSTKIAKVWFQVPVATESGLYTEISNAISR
jgi:hypothetical protein